MLTFGELTRKDEPVPSPKTFTTDERPAIPREDWAVLNLIDPNLETGPWIAGGAPLRWFQRLPMERGDVDVWCASKEQFNNLTIKIMHYGAYEMISTPNATTYTWKFSDADSDVIEREFKIQLCKQQFANANELISAFDLSVCQIATDGETYIVGETTVPDIETKTLRIVNQRPDLLRRIIKYSTYGYTLPAAEFIEYLNREDTTWVGSGDDYEAVALSVPTRIMESF